MVSRWILSIRPDDKKIWYDNHDDNYVDISSFFLLLNKSKPFSKRQIMENKN